jgi:hypothetical protein
LPAAAQQIVSVPDAVSTGFSNILPVNHGGFDDLSGNMGTVDKDSLRSLGGLRRDDRPCAGDRANLLARR